MIEDREFNAFLKGKLEEGLQVPPLRMAPSFRRRRMLALAAGLAVVCGLGVWLATGNRVRIDEGVVQALDYLEALDGIAAVHEAPQDLADRLLAWQDAPYDELFN